MKFKKLHPGAKAPTYSTDGAACFDLYAIHPINIPAGQARTLDTGLAFDIPAGHALMVYSRSGHAFKAGVRLSNAVGVIDSDYKSEVQVKLHNDGHEGYYVQAGERVAQAMLIKVERVGLEEVDEIDETGRGGFGSTGLL